MISVRSQDTTDPSFTIANLNQLNRIAFVLTFGRRHVR